PDWLTDLSEQNTAGEESAAALVRQRQDRPLDELGDKLKGLRQRGLNLNVVNVSGDTPAIERIIPGVSNTLPAVVFDPGDVEFISDVLLSPEQEQATAVLAAMTGAAAGGEVQPAKRRLPNLFSERAVIGLLLLAVMALPFVTDLFNIGERPPAQFALGSVELGFFNAVRSEEHTSELQSREKLV